ncbi:hypothetical protein Ccrd_022932, partial [Cynara cardunculus var. scolymus]
MKWENGVKIIMQQVILCHIVEIKGFGFLVIWGFCWIYKKGSRAEKQKVECNPKKYGLYGVLSHNVLNGADLVIHQTKECLDEMGEWCQDYHVA